jgi:hypothetical protein
LAQQNTRASAQSPGTAAEGAASSDSGGAAPTSQPGQS